MELPLYKYVEIKKDIYDTQCILNFFENGNYQSCKLSFDIIHSHSINFIISHEIENIIIPVLEKFIEDQEKLLRIMRGE